MLRDDLFLLAHDDDGRLLVSEPVISAGLAGAMLVDLLLGERVAVVGGRLDVIDSAATGDTDLDATVEAIGANRDPTGPRAWVSWISAGVYERTAAALELAGAVKRTSARRLGLLPVTRCVPTNPDDLVRLRSRLRYGVVHPAEEPDPPTAALAGLVRVLRLHSALLLSMSSADIIGQLERLERPLDGEHTTIRQVIRAVDAVITAAAYR
jgi:hypothetical protein